MKLSSYQMSRMLEQKMSERIIAANQRGDRVSEAEWKALVVKMEKKKLSQRINEEFILEFTKWLNGKSTYNALQFEELHYNDQNQVIARQTVSGCPWGSHPLTPVPGVTQFLDQGIDRRDAVIRYLAKLKLTGPRNLDECWMYFKYIIRQVGIDDYAVHEVESMAPYDYPIGPDGTPSGPTQPVPGYFDQVQYRLNREVIELMIEYSPRKFAKWLANGSPGTVAGIRKSFGSGFKDDLLAIYGEENLTKHLAANPADGLTSEQARDRRLKEFERLRNERAAQAAAPVTSFVTVPGARAGPSGGGGNIGPDWMRSGQQRRRFRQRDRLREEAEMEQELLEAEAKLQDSLLGFGGISWESLSEDDKDLFLVESLTYGLTEIPTLVYGYNTSPDGAPVVPPPPRHRDTHMTNSLPDEQLKRIDKSIKNQMENLKSFLKQQLPQAGDNSEIVKILKSIDLTLSGSTQQNLQSIRQRMDETFDVDSTGMNPDVNVNVKAPDVYVPPPDLSPFNDAFEKQGVVLNEVYKVLSTLKNDGLKIRAEDMPLNGNGQPKDDMGGGAIPVLADSELKEIMQQTNALLTQFSQNPYLSGKALPYNPILTNPVQNVPGIQKVTLVDQDGRPWDGIVNASAQQPPAPPGGGGVSNFNSTGPVTASGPMTGAVTASGDITATGPIHAAGGVAVQDATINTTGQTHIGGDVVFNNPQFQVTVDPSTPVTQNIKQEIAAQNFTIDGNQVTIPAPNLNVNTVQVNMDLTQFNENLKTITQSSMELANQSRQDMAQVSGMYSELIQNLKAASNEQTTKFNALVQKAENLSDQQLRIVGALSNLPNDILGRISNNMDTEVVRTGLVDDLQTLGISKETMKAVFSGDSKAAEILQGLAGTLPTNQTMGNMLQTMSEISGGISALKDEMFRVNKTLEQSETTEMAFRQSMTRQLGKIGRINQPDMGDLDVHSLRGMKKVNEAYNVAVSHVQTLEAQKQKLHAQKEQLKQTITGLHQRLGQMQSSGDNSDRAVETVRDTVAAVSNLTTELDKTSAEIARVETDYLDSYGAAVGVGSTILNQFRHPESGTMALDPNAVQQAIAERVAKAEERDRLEEGEETLELESASMALAGIHQQLQAGQPVTAEEVDRVVAVFEDVQERERERTGREPIWSETTVNQITAAQRNPQAFGPRVNNVSMALQIFGGESPQSSEQTITPELIAQAVEATGASPASIERLQRFRGVYKLSKEIRDMLEINQRRPAPPAAPLAINAPPAQEESQMMDTEPQPLPASAPIIEEPPDEETERALESMLQNNQAGFSREEQFIISEVLRGGTSSSILQLDPQLAEKVYNLADQARQFTQLQLGDSGYRQVIGPIKEYLDAHRDVYDAIDKTAKDVTPLDLNTSQNYAIAEINFRLLDEGITNFSTQNPEQARAILSDPNLSAKQKLNVMFQGSNDEGLVKNAVTILDELERTAGTTNLPDFTKQTPSDTGGYSIFYTNSSNNPLVQKAKENPMGLPEIMTHLTEMFAGTNTPAPSNEAEAASYVAFAMAARDIVETIQEQQLHLSQEQLAAIQQSNDIGETVKAHKILEDQGLGAKYNDPKTGQEKFMPSPAATMYGALHTLTNKMSALNRMPVVAESDLFKAAKRLDVNAFSHVLNQMDQSNAKLPSGNGHANLVPRYAQNSPVTGASRGVLLLELDAVTSGLYNHLSEVQKYDRETVSQQYRKFSLIKDGSGETYSDPGVGGDIMNDQMRSMATMMSKEGYNSMISAEALVKTKINRLNAEALVRNLSHDEIIEKETLKDMSRAIVSQRIDYFIKMGPDYQKYRDHSENVVNNLVSDMTQAYSTLYQSGIEASAQFKAMQQYETVRDEMDAASSLAALVDSPATTKAIYDQLLTGKKVASFATTDIIQREALKKLKEGRFEKAAMSKKLIDFKARTYRAEELQYKREADLRRAKTNIKVQHMLREAKRFRTTKSARK